MTSEPAPPDPSSPLYKPTMYQQPPVPIAPTNVQSNSTSSVQASPTDLLNSGLTSGSGTSSGNGSSSTGSGKKSGASRISAVTGVLGLSVAGFVGVLALL
jgi:hypothetical protein